MIQDKTKTRFGKWIHDVLAHYIYFLHFQHKTTLWHSPALIGPEEPGAVDFVYIGEK